jgi:chromosome segregation ATPase
MPRVHFVKKALKDNDVVKKGEPYYWWKFRHGGKHLSKTHPRQSQLTQSDKLSRLYAAQEGVEDAALSGEFTGTDVDNLRQAVDDAKSEVESVKEEYEESHSNMESAFPNGCPVMEEIQEKVDACEGIIDSLDSALSELDGLDSDLDEALQKFEEADEALSALEDTMTDKTPEEMEPLLAAAREKKDEAEQAVEDLRTQVTDAVEGISWDI